MATHEAKTRSIIQRGTRANQPLATNVQTGTLYYVTDEDIVERSSGSAWQTYSTAAAHSPVTLAGSLDYLTLSGQQITRGAIDLTTDVTGLLPVANLANHVWAAESFDAGKFTAADSMTWTVAEADVEVYRYVKVGKILFVNLYLNTTTVGGTLSSYLMVRIPGGYTGAQSTSFIYQYVQTGSGSGTGAVCEVYGGDTKIYLYKDYTGTGNFSAGTNDTYVHASLAFEIQ